MAARELKTLILVISLSSSGRATLRLGGRVGNHVDRRERWDERFFHPHRNQVSHRALLSSLKVTWPIPCPAAVIAQHRERWQLAPVIVTDSFSAQSVLSVTHKPHDCEARHPSCQWQNSTMYSSFWSEGIRRLKSIILCADCAAVGRSNRHTSRTSEKC